MREMARPHSFLSTDPMALPHILIVEDDPVIGALVARHLRENDCRASLANSGSEMDWQLAASRVDLIILDLMLPGEDGLSLCRRLRESSAIPILMLTAKSEDVDRILGLEMGADDYLAKPFNPRELLARIKAVLRRSSRDGTTPERPARAVTFAGWRLDIGMRRLKDPEGVTVSITSAEFDLLRAFCEWPGKVLSRDQLLGFTQHRTAGPYERSIDVLVSRLRRKTERDPRLPELIKTVRPRGYVFTPEVEAE
ncbi:MAG: response regulator [Hyphomicrobiales bacterium]